MPWPWRRLHDFGHYRFWRFQELRKYLYAKRVIGRRIVAVVDVAERTNPATGNSRTSPIIIKSLFCTGVQQTNLRPIDLFQLDSRFAVGNCFGHELKQRFQSGRFQIDSLWQFDVIELLEKVANHRIDFGVVSKRMQIPCIADAAFLFQLHRHQHQRAAKSLVWFLFQIGPVQHAQHDSQLLETIFRQVTSRFSGNSIQLRRKVNGFRKIQPFVQ